MKMKVKEQPIPVTLMKIVGIVLLVVLLGNRNRLLPVLDVPWLNAAATVVSLGALIWALRSFYLNIGRIMIALEERNEPARKHALLTSQGRAYPVERLLHLLAENEIIAFDIRHEGKIISLGANADSKPGRALFDKQFYLNDRTVTLEDLQSALNACQDENGMITVVAMDGEEMKEGYPA